MKTGLLCCLISLLFVFTDVNDISAQNAKWITAEENQSATNTWLGFKKEFALSGLPEKMETRIAVDSKYWLWINDRLVVFEGGVKRGPNPRDTYYDSLDIAPFLKEGKNVIAVLVWHFGKQGFSHNPSGSAALFFEAISNNVSVVSDGTWKSFVHPAYYTPLGEIPNFRLPESNIGYDANKSMDGWFLSTTGCNFSSSKELGVEGDAPWNQLKPRHIPLWKDYGYADYVSVKRLEGAVYDTLLCRLPYNAQITPYFKVKANKGDVVSIHTDHYLGGGSPNVRAEYIAKNGIQEYESLGWMNGHIVYYVIPHAMDVQDLKYRETSYNTEFVGSFECNDDFFNRYWEKSRRTLLVTMRDTYMDCPDRERSQWWGDAVNESGETFYALCPKSHLLTKKAMYELIGWQRKDGAIYSPIPSSNWDKELPGQMLASIGYFGFWNYYLHTGDLQTISDLYEGVKRYLSVWEKNSDGTVKMRQTAWVWGDWGSNIDKEALFNAWYYIALKGAKNMANALGYDNDQKKIAEEMELFKKGFNTRFWNGKAYRSSSYKEDTDDRVQALAVVGGLADKNLYPMIFRLLQTQEHASPYMEKYVTEACFIMGKGEYGLQRMKKRYSDMVNDPECSTLYEGWGVGSNGFGGGSRNHAWSGGGLTLLSQYVCGISPIEPGYSKFAVKPIFAGLKKAAAEMECVKGKINVLWEKHAGKFTMQVKVPAGTQCLVGIPKEKIKEITCNGELIWKKKKNMNQASVSYSGADDNYIHFTVSQGNFFFEAR